MKNISVLWLGVVGVAFGFGEVRAQAAALTVVRADAAAIVYEGRTAITDHGAVRMAFPGVAIHLRMRGNYLALHVNAATEDVLFDVEMDGDAATRRALAKGESDLVLVQSATPAEHAFTLTRRTESWMGACEIVSVVTDGAGELLAPAPLPERKLLFIGDSVTCGASTEARLGQPMEGKTRRQNARLSYGKLLAGRLHAQCQLVACGGRGLLRDWQGIRAIRTPAEYYENALPDEPAVRWDPHRYVPDAIGVCLGTNDFDEGIPDQTEFVRTYAEFIRKLRHDAPAAHLWLIVSPILKDDPAGVPKRTVLQAYYREVVRRVGDPLLAVATISNYPTIPNDGHPDGAAHVAIADELEPIFREGLSWKN